MNQLTPDPNQQNKRNMQIALSAGASLSAYLIFCSIFGALAILAGLADMRTSHFPGASLIALGVLVGFLIWLRAFGIKILDDVLCYRSLFGGAQFIPLVDVNCVQSKVGSFETFGPFMQLIITPLPHLKTPPIVVNMKVFSRRDLDSLLDILQPKLISSRRTSIFRKK